ncbi:MAG: hypothetical protein KGH60_00885 [Candidatus Micrarchaeota archaeon]|nr:hypothetical protein [Candidatus Micrarchaeota archaeon]
MELLLIRIASILVIGAVYTLFDILNKRNVPEVFAYGTLAFGAVLTVLYLDFNSILVSTAIALVVLGLGYLVYRIGQIGAADIIEFAAISLILPFQAMPYLGNLQQFGLPFVLSVLVSSGIVALAMVPLYYLPRARRILKMPITSYIDNRGLFKATLITIVYALFVAFLGLDFGTGIAGLTIIAVLLVCSSIVMLFEKPIANAMVEMVPVSKFDEGDIIALNLMSKTDVLAMKRKVKGFDRLVTLKLLQQMRAKRIAAKFPVYKKAMPLALPIFIGIVISLLFGNIILYLLPG